MKDSTVREATDALLLASRVFVAIAARSMPEADVTLPQFRALVLLATRRELTVGALAEMLNIEPSTATRLCDRLVAKDLIRREWCRDSRRNVCLTLTEAGAALVGEATAKRRMEIAKLVRKMPAADRTNLAQAVNAFVAVANEEPDEAWVLGWSG